MILNFILVNIAFTGAMLISMVSSMVNYNEDLDLCCADGSVHRRNSSTVECCGPTVYDRLHFVCCDRQLYPIPAGGDEYHFCCHDPESGVVSLYDPRRQECCDGMPVVLPAGNSSSDVSCCGRMLYDRESHLCCNGSILERTPGEASECCGGIEYNTLRQACCVRHDADAASQFHVLDFAGGRTRCCGLRLYDPSTESCCDDTVQSLPSSTWSTLCCKDVPYEPLHQICCPVFEVVGGRSAVTQGKLYPRTDAADSCCGTEAYDSRAAVCCNGAVVRKPEDAHWGRGGSCCGGQVIADPETQLCYREAVMTVNGSDFDVCGGRPYDMTRQHCCGGEVLDNGSGYECCGGVNEQKFRPGKESCCNEEYVIPITASDKAAGRTTCCFPW